MGNIKKRCLIYITIISNVFCSLNVANACDKLIKEKCMETLDVKPFLTHKKKYGEDVQFLYIKNDTEVEILELEEGFLKQTFYRGLLENWKLFDKKSLKLVEERTRFGPIPVGTDVEYDSSGIAINTVIYNDLSWIEKAAKTMERNLKMDLWKDINIKYRFDGMFEYAGEYGYLFIHSNGDDLPYNSVVSKIQFIILNSKTAEVMAQGTRYETTIKIDDKYISTYKYQSNDGGDLNIRNIGY